MDKKGEKKRKECKLHPSGRKEEKGKKMTLHVHIHREKEQTLTEITY